MSRLAVAAAAVVAAGAAPAPALATHEDDAQHRGITTRGAAVVTAPHDLARITFGVSMRRATPARAQAAASARLARVISAVRRAGVPAEEVRTGSIRLYRVTRRAPGGRIRTLGFRSAQSVRVTVRDLPRTSTVLDAGIRAGATSVSGPRFDISDRAGVYRQALRAALRDAREKAQALAEEAGVTLGRAVTVVEGGDVEPSGSFLSAAAAEDEAASGRTSTPVRPGNEQIGATVSVTFETG